MKLQELVFGSSDTKTSKQITKLESAGKLRKIAARIYTSNFSEQDEAIVRRNLFLILGKLYPGVLVSHRSAVEFKPTSAGHFFLTFSYTRKIDLPGVTLRFLEGSGPIQGDNPLSGELYVSQLERALLENMQVSRQVGPESKTLTLPEIEAKLEEVIRVRGESGLNELRDKARKISMELGMEPEFDKLNRLISALLTTHPSKILTSPLALARAFGFPYDPERLKLFEKLFITLRNLEFPLRADQNESPQAFRNFSFFEAYFSNYIEGTEFEIEDAKRIIETDTPLPARDEDSHDILGTYKLVSSKTEMQIVPESPEELFEILLYRHRMLLSARISKNPGQFKNKNNRAGETFFVDYNLVRGTLLKGFDFYNGLSHPFAKAAFMMFMVSEVHPFLDGNGRVARVMMNAELTKQGQSKIIIPTVFREDYMLALRKITRQQESSAYVRMLSRAWEFSANIFGEDIDEMEKNLRRCNAFSEPDQGNLKIIKFGNAEVN